MTKKKGGRPRIDICGHRFWKLVVLEEVQGASPSRWLCRCDCGAERVIRTSDLRRKTRPTRSCGCVLRMPSMIRVDGAVAFVQLGKSGLEAIIGAEDVALVEGWTWWFEKTNGYIVGQNGKARSSLHRLVMGAKQGEYVDHIHGNKLDNRKSELRFCTQAENGANRLSRNVNNTSGFRGVSKVGNRWYSTIMVNRKSKYLGTFDTPEEAAMAYDEAAKEYHGEFATLNNV